MRSYTPLRYPGGKAKIFKQVKLIVEKNYTDPPIYAEAFVGGSGLALKLLMKGVVKEIHINDLDYAIFAFWDAVLNHKNELIDLIKNAVLNIKEWKKQKEIYMAKNNGSYTSLEIGFATFYLNRTNRSGILLAGPIGGQKQNGNYLIDCRFHKDRIIDIINKIHEYKEMISIYNEDAKAFIKRIDSDNDDRFIFLDPPYVKQGKNLYMNSFVEDDHRELGEQVDLLKSKWITTYDNVDLISDIYKRYKLVRYNIHYSMSQRRTEKEIAIFSKGLQGADEFGLVATESQ